MKYQTDYYAIANKLSTLENFSNINSEIKIIISEIFCYICNI